MLAWAQLNEAVVLIDDQTAVNAAKDRCVTVRRSLALIAGAYQTSALTPPQARCLVDDLVASGARFPCDGTSFERWAETNGLIVLPAATSWIRTTAAAFTAAAVADAEIDQAARRGPGPVGAVAAGKARQPMPIPDIACRELAWFNSPMPHDRRRHVVDLILKKLRFAPVVAIQGARQTGKSFLARDLLKARLEKLVYVSFDQFSAREFATGNPETFLSQHRGARPLVIDEAQKVPHIFDAIKYQVDRQRIPGQFLLLGSTEFSKLTLIREALTGRMSRVRLFPLNAAETLGLPQKKITSASLLSDPPRVGRADLTTYLERGGMPGIFAVRSDAERQSLLRDWLDLTAERDALLFPRVKIEPDLCMRIMEKVALLDEPDAGTIARALRRDLRRVKTHLEVLTSLFALHRLDPHPAGTGKPRYFLCDVAFARLLGASFERQLHTWLLQEQLSQRAYEEERATGLFYYRTPKGRVIHLVLESPGTLTAIKIFPEERVLARDLEILTAFRTKLAGQKTQLLGLGGGTMLFRKEKVQIFPWEAMA